jgi:hypothetical protein
MTFFAIGVTTASLLLIVSYWYIPRNAALGWALSLAGNGLYIVPVVTLHKPELLIVPSVFTVLSGWNLWQELTKVTKN